MSHATLSDHAGATSAASSLLRQLDRATRFPCVLREPLDVDPCGWLAAQPSKSKFLWRDRSESLIRAAVDTVHHLRATPGEPLGALLSRCRMVLADLPDDQRLFGGFAFQFEGPALASPWTPFRRGEFWLPRITLNEGMLGVLVVSRDDTAAARQAIERLVFGEAPLSRHWPECDARVDEPNADDWARNIGQAMELFADEVLEKVVLARQVSLSFASTIDPWALVSSMAGVTPNCYQFAFQPEPDAVFLGATPERLYERHAGLLSSEVVAGTRRRGHTPDDDARLAAELMASDKEQLEHHIVRKSIRQRLHALVDSLEIDARASLLKLANKQHLFSRVSARLRADTRDEDLLGRLHPTPAVGGYPTENALEEIARLEPFERGWFAAPVGWISRESSEFVVAIRSALARGRSLHLFSGAGIVPGSTPEAEWDEIESKIDDFLQILLPDER